MPYIGVSAIFSPTMMKGFDLSPCPYCRRLHHLLSQITFWTAEMCIPVGKLFVSHISNPLHLSENVTRKGVSQRIPTSHGPKSDWFITWSDGPPVVVVLWFLCHCPTSPVLQLSDPNHQNPSSFLYMQVSWNRGTPNNHPFLDGIFHEINPPFWASPMTMVQPPYFSCQNLLGISPFPMSHVWYPEISWEKSQRRGPLIDGYPKQKKHFFVGISRRNHPLFWGNPVDELATHYHPLSSIINHILTIQLLGYPPMFKTQCVTINHWVKSHFKLMVI